MTWRAQAACRGQDTELVFPGGRDVPAELQVAEAKKFCSQCAVRSPCLEAALTGSAEHGVWGGKSEDERRTIMRQAARRRRTVFH